MFRKRVVWGIPLLLLAMMFVVGCNIFSFSHSASSSDDYVAEGRDYLREGKYQDAIDSFTKAIEEDSLDAAARWGRAKAYLRWSGFTAPALLAELAKLQTNPDPGQTSSLPLMDLPDGSADSLYVALQNVLVDLTVISNGTTSEEYTPETIRLDYIFTTAMNGLIILRDTNQDGRINVPSGSDFNVFALFNQDGLQFENLEDWQNLDPAAQSAIINTVQNLLETSSETVLSMLSDVTGDSTDTQGFDVGAIGSVVDSINVGLDAYDPLHTP